MSGRLVSAVFDSALPAWLKPYAAALASFAAEDGTRVYPSIATIAQMLGRTPRAVKYALAALRACHLLKELAPAGRQRATTYQILAEQLPQVSDGQQIAFGVGFPQGFPQGTHPNTQRKRDFHSHAQAWVNPRSPKGERHFTRSVSDPPSTSTHLRARAEKAKGECPKKTGTHR